MEAIVSGNADHALNAAKELLREAATDLVRIRSGSLLLDPVVNPG
jgi:hypothetical protein